MSNGGGGRVAPHALRVASGDVVICLAGGGENIVLLWNADEENWRKISRNGGVDQVDKQYGGDQ